MSDLGCERFSINFCSIKKNDKRFIEQFWHSLAFQEDVCDILKRFGQLPLEDTFESMALIKRYREQCVEVVELKNTIEAKDVEIEEVKAAEAKEMEIKLQEKDRNLEEVEFEKAKENFALKKSNETLLDAITSLNAEVTTLQIQPRDGSEITSDTLKLVKDNEELKSSLSAYL